VAKATQNTAQIAGFGQHFTGPSGELAVFVRFGLAILTV
jgi:hypothetical protein